jgi:hypothetical protein
VNLSERRRDDVLNVYTCTDHDGHWVGVASVVVAETEDIARDLLKAELRGHGLNADLPFTLRRINIAHPRAFVLQDGDYLREEIVDRQELLDRFYFQRGPCCAGCDWWRSISSLVGDCTKQAPVSSADRWEMLGIENCSLKPTSGHVVTAREHVCGDFKDEFDWTTLALSYRKRIGAPV